MSIHMSSAMNDRAVSRVTDVQTSIIDAVNGYERMLDKAEVEFRGTIRNLIEQHQSDERALRQVLDRAGAASQNNGSFMTNVHQTVVTVRSWFDDIDADLIPQIISGEERIIDLYDQAIKASDQGEALETLSGQRTALASAIEGLRSTALAR
jgi:Domain of unknown function (DUF2383)